MGARVISLERIPRLAEHACGVLERLGYADRVTVEVADGTLGWPPGAPYDAIVVTAGAPPAPPPPDRHVGGAGAAVAPHGGGAPPGAAGRAARAPGGRGRR